MAFLTGFAIFFIIWWLTLFIILPIGVQSQAEAGDIVEGTEPAAPVQSFIVRKLLINTIVAGVIFAIYWFVTQYLGYGFADIPDILPK